MAVPVPDLIGPLAQLCWAQAPSMARCDRRLGHTGPHSWQVPVPRQEPQTDVQGQVIDGD